MRTSTLSRTVVWSVAAALFLSAVACAPLRTGPQSVAELDAMSQEDYEAWAGRVEVRCELIGEAAVQYGAKAEDIERFADLLGGVTNTTGSPFLAAATAAGLDDALVKMIVLDLEDALNAHGGLTPSPRGLDLVHRMATAIGAGARRAASSGQPVDPAPVSSTEPLS